MSIGKQLAWSALAGCIGFALIYFACAFVKLEPNPVNWHESVRAFCAFMGFFAALLSFGITFAALYGAHEQ
jgi:hypothetical protein